MAFLTNVAEANTLQRNLRVKNRQPRCVFPTWYNARLLRLAKANAPNSYLPSRLIVATEQKRRAYDASFRWWHEQHDSRLKPLAFRAERLFVVAGAKPSNWLVGSSQVRDVFHNQCNSRYCDRLLNWCPEQDSN